VPPLVDPRAVEMNIFADLTISKRQKCLCARMGEKQNIEFTVILQSFIKLFKPFSSYAFRGKNKTKFRFRDKVKS